MAQIFVNPSQKTGSIKPMHGVNQPPFQGTDYSMFHYLTEAGVPFSRTHDVGGYYGGGRFIDIPNLFRDFNADPEDPSAYDFTFTDEFITALMKAGVQPFFRLGVTIENEAYRKAYRIYPPEDNLKWARICEGVIRHYTEGWADGFRYDVRYWEIWNEPDNIPDPMINQMWRGSAEQYYKLYEVSSKYLKARFPHLRIGGYASCGFYALTGGGDVPKEWTDYYIQFFEDFLVYIRAHDCPLDFFSWHSYSSVENTVKWTEYTTRKLEEFGYGEAEQFLNEWNVEPAKRGTLRHAAMTAGMLLATQDSPLSGTMFYDARLGVSIYGGLFNPLTYEPFPAYYAFQAFNELYSRKTQIRVSSDTDGVYAVAAHDGKSGCVMIANTLEETLPLQLDTQSKILRCRIIDEGRNLTECALPQTLPPYAVLCVEFE